MASTQTKTFIQLQTLQYQRHLTLKNKAINTLEHQNNLKLYKTIPKDYYPKKLLATVTPDSLLAQEFAQEFQNIFFQHLDKVITENQITLELEEARLRDTILQTEKHLTTIKASREVITQLYDDFIQTNKIQTLAILPELQKMLLPTTTDTTVIDPLQTKLTPKKRPAQDTEQAKPHQKRLCHFLAKRLHINTPMT